MATQTPSDLPSWQKSVPTIHNMEHSQSMRVVWALQEIQDAKGLKYHIKTYPRQQPKNFDLLKVSPLGKSPILTVETLDGKPLPNVQIRDGILMESGLIIQWIADNCGGRELWEPEDDQDKRRNEYFRQFAYGSLVERVDQAMLFEVMAFMSPFPLNHIMGLILRPLANMFKSFLIIFLDLMESELSEERPWFAGRKLGEADFAMEFPLSMAITRGYVDKEKYPKIHKWYDMVTARPAYQEAIKKGGGPKKYDLVRFGM
ncbi:hypothetical protein PFICI_03901 [Pestalotiopsis fici W106-1]|uniref:GST C-terminal domain-containing protein n=1 Tax=Pestalotiopsis fici (strain W106-1 / CGMCC3.15140) TaxID=1229662 RepID=W3XKW6_PESFW|nr:uncharacterized protein PFICI_03901 [Pestalotiopsis fici W106-1]ETS85876.1 hypothetical protein PFICI_03901 [Pestalotiopsis fici W106-1]